MVDCPVNQRQMTYTQAGVTMSSQPGSSNPSNITSVVEMFGFINSAQSNGWAEVRMPILPRHCRSATPRSGVQGGVIVALADHAFVNASSTVVQPGQSTTTTELKVNFIATAVEGHLIATCRLIHYGRRLHVGDIEITDGNGKLIAKGLGSNMVIEQRWP